MLGRSDEEGGRIHFAKVANMSVIFVLATSIFSGSNMVRTLGHLVCSFPMMVRSTGVLSFFTKEQ